MIRARWKGHLLELHNAALRWESVNKHALTPTLPHGGVNLERAGKTFLGCKSRTELGSVEPRVCRKKL